MVAGFQSCALPGYSVPVLGADAAVLPANVGLVLLYEGLGKVSVERA